MTSLTYGVPTRTACLGVGAFVEKQFEQHTRCVLDEAATIKEGSPRRVIDLQGGVNTRKYG